MPACSLTTALSRIDLAKLRDDEAVKSHFKEATRWVQEVWSIQGMVRKLEKRISRYCDFGENWEAEKLFHAELSVVYTYCNKRSVAWERLSEFHAWIYPSHQKSDNTLKLYPLFTKVPSKSSLSVGQGMHLIHAPRISSDHRRSWEKRCGMLKTFRCLKAKWLGVW